MIIGTGIDLVSISRFQEMPRKDRLAKRILTENEYLARVWAVKEAASKSFGTGIADDVVWKNMQLSKSDRGQPILQLQKELQTKNMQCHVSISHDGDMLIATAILSNVSRS